MEVILKQDVKNLGRAGEIVKVSDGYARNFLFPGNMAIPVTEKNVERIKQEFLKKKEAGEMLRRRSEEIVEKLKGMEIVLYERASEDGTLYGSVSRVEILKELNKMGYELEKSNIILHEHIKKTGIFEVTVRLMNNIEAVIKIKVVASGGKK